MAILQNPLISRASGSVGNSIFSKWKDKNTLRSKSVLPYPAPTLLQSVQRAKFKNCTAFFTPAKYYSEYLFSSSASKVSALNSFVKQNISLFSPDQNIIYVEHVRELVFSRGAIESFFQVNAFQAGVAQIGVQGSYLFDYLDDDVDVRTIAFVVDIYTKLLYCFASDYGSSLAVVCDFPYSCIGHEMFVFCCQSDRKKKKSSTSKFITSIVLS